jgi:hypothetical protein
VSAARAVSRETTASGSAPLDRSRRARAPAPQVGTGGRAPPRAERVPEAHQHRTKRLDAPGRVRRDLSCQLVEGRQGVGRAIGHGRHEPGVALQDVHQIRVHRRLGEGRQRRGVGARARHDEHDVDDVARLDPHERVERAPEGGDDRAAHGRGGPVLEAVEQGARDAEPTLAKPRRALRVGVGVTDVAVDQVEERPKAAQGHGGMLERGGDTALGLVEGRGLAREDPLAEPVTERIDGVGRGAGRLGAAQ